MRKRILSFGATLAVLASLMVAVPAGAVTPAPVVTPTQAKAIVTHWVATMNKAEATYDRKLLATVTSAETLAIIDARFRISHHVGLAHRPGYKAVGLQVFVPPQTTRPALFAVSFHEQKSGKAPTKFLTLMVFRQPSASTAWRATNLTYIRPGGPVPHFVVGKDGYIPALNSAALSITPKFLNAKWIALEETAVLGHPLSSQWARTPLLNDLGSGFAPNDARSVFYGKVSPTAYPPLCLAAVGGALCFLSSAELFRSTMRAQPVAQGWRFILKTPEDRYEYGGIAAGNYTQLSANYLTEVGVLLPSAHSTQKFQLLSIFGDPVSGSGVRG